MSIRALAIAHGIQPVTAYARIRRGWDAYRACTTPARAYFREWQPMTTNHEEK